MCRHPPSAFLSEKRGGWTYESEVSSPSIRRVTSMRMRVCVCVFCSQLLLAHQTPLNSLFGNNVGRCFVAGAVQSRREAQASWRARRLEVHPTGGVQRVPVARPRRCVAFPLLLPLITPVSCLSGRLSNETRARKSANRWRGARHRGTRSDLSQQISDVSSHSRGKISTWGGQKKVLGGTPRQNTCS